jgi:alkanesulfonate monooxygenase SsuD/methylene tetrahydromethanopterin reductase-like flavin-dependent oxidoreductase (luciferase family)
LVKWELRKGNGNVEVVIGVGHPPGIAGSPATCVAQIKALQQAGIAYFGCNFAFGGMAHHKVMRSMQLFAEEVMPYFCA